MTEEDSFEIDMDEPIAQAFNRRKLQLRSKKKQKNPPETTINKVVPPKSTTTKNNPILQITMEVNIPPEITVSLFDYSIENHFKAVKNMCKLSGESETPNFNPDDIKRFSSSITFLREWKYFNYKPKTIKFARSNESGNEKEVIGEINLPQFSSASVPKKKTLNGISSFSSKKDFVLYAGGPIWAMDWCPRVDNNSECNIKMEFVAVAAHSPESSYHKIGAPLIGRGLIQIWGLLNIGSEEYIPNVKKKKRRYNRVPTVYRKLGRPRKNPLKNVENNDEKLSRPKRKKKKTKNYNENESEEDLNKEEDSDYELDSLRIKADEEKEEEEESDKFDVPKDVSLPRLMLCLAHHGRTTWDLKWKPCSESYVNSTMGYLAVILGNGALEVWEVPFPRTVEVIYDVCKKEGTDPRFMKLKPVFKCEKLMSGDIQSIPLTVEWSASSPNNMILAGCHDGVVAMWKFSAEDSCKDTRPLLCFSAHTAPIRALAWAPAESGSESENVIVTAGHKGMKFWDIRDPYRPLWDFDTVKAVLYSLDWLSDPRCVIVCFDDGTLRTLSLVKAAYDVAVTGQPFGGKPQQGFPSYLCCSYAIWCLNVSKKTGMAAYCTADGNTLRFPLTTRAVERDHFRNRDPHFLCGSFCEEEESVLMVVTPDCDIPFPMKSAMNNLCDGPRTKRGFVSVSNQKKRAKEEEEAISKKNALVLGDVGSDNDEVDTSIGIKSSEEVEVEELPSKMVALHKVRWNMNKGSERWLSYGGAAGIVRCQEVNIDIT